MMASVRSPPSAERTVTLTRPETTTITVSPGSLRVNTTWPRRKLRSREAAAAAFRSGSGTDRSRLVSRRIPVRSAGMAGSRVHRVAGAGGVAGAGHGVAGYGVAGHGP